MHWPGCCSPYISLSVTLPASFAVLCIVVAAFQANAAANGTNSESTDAKGKSDPKTTVGVLAVIITLFVLFTISLLLRRARFIFELNDNTLTVIKLRWFGLPVWPKVPPRASG